MKQSHRAENSQKKINELEVISNSTGNRILKKTNEGTIKKQSSLFWKYHLKDERMCRWNHHSLK